MVPFFTTEHQYPIGRPGVETQGLCSGKKSLADASDPNARIAGL
jgi:hypothetical protein